MAMQTVRILNTTKGTVLGGRARYPGGLRRNAQDLPGLDDVRPADLAAVAPVEHRPCGRVVIDAPGDRGKRVTRPDGVGGRPGGTWRVRRCLARSCQQLR